jgi:pilus assembly protein Flp/PilA
MLQAAVAMLKNVLREEKGQGMVEYGLILALISVVVVGILTTMGTNLQALFTTVSGQL